MASSSLPDITKQDGTVAEKPILLDQNTLQKHVAFFDKNQDGMFTHGRLIKVFAQLGVESLCPLELPFSSILGKYPSPLLPIEVKNIHLAKHGSDSGVYDSEGRFVPSKFEEIFNRHALTYPHALTSDELSAMLKANRVPKDYIGWLASYSEWKIVYLLCKDKNGLLHEDTVRAVYDGSLFERMENEYSSEKKKM